MVCALLLSTLAQAWGPVGHSVVGELAQARLTPEARAAVDELLSDQPSPTLAGVASWADDVRSNAPEYRWTVPLHWVNFEPGRCHYQRSLNCPEGLCVVAAIERFAREINDPLLPDERRATALRFLVHFVGDVHQPLHAGYVRDRGGNTFQISYRGEGWNLHSVWDSLLITSLTLDWRSYTARLEEIPLSDSARSALPILEPARWAEESCRLTQSVDFYPPRHKIRRSYVEAKRPIADQRLKLAGERLAALLNRAFAPR